MERKQTNRNLPGWKVSWQGMQTARRTLVRFAEFIAEMRRGHGRFSTYCADLTEGLAYTGMRKNEAAQAICSDVGRDTLRVTGNLIDDTKNGLVRYISLIPRAPTLFSRMLAEPAGRKPQRQIVWRAMNAKKQWNGRRKKLA